MQTPALAGTESRSNGAMVLRRTNAAAVADVTGFSERSSMVSNARAGSRHDQIEASESDLRHEILRKDALLREAHHRVVNTLQIASSLLRLHANSTASAEVRSSLSQSNERLRVLAEVHRMLSRMSGDTQDIVMSELLGYLSHALQQSFAETTERVSLHVTCGHVHLSPDDAVPIALFANEVITNAYKHAFPNDVRGKITLSLSHGPESTLILTIIDDGIGVNSSDKGADLGQKLIGLFAAQLRGKLEVAAPHATSGTAVTLTIQHRPTRR